MRNAHVRINYPDNLAANTTECMPRDNARRIKFCYDEKLLPITMRHAVAISQERREELMRQARQLVRKGHAVSRASSSTVVFLAETGHYRSRERGENVRGTLVGDGSTWTNEMRTSGGNMGDVCHCQ